MVYILSMEYLDLNLEFFIPELEIYNKEYDPIRYKANKLKRMREELIEEGQWPYLS